MAVQLPFLLSLAAQRFSYNAEELGYNTKFKPLPVSARTVYLLYKYCWCFVVQS